MERETLAPRNAHEHRKSLKKGLSLDRVPGREELAREEPHRQQCQPNTKDTAVTVQLCKPATPGGNSDPETQKAIAGVEQKLGLRELQSLKW